MSSVEESRREFERRLHEVRAAVGREVGFVPTKLGWILPIAAVALGVGLALKSGKSSRKR